MSKLANGGASTPKYLIEFIGTFFLVLTICLTGNPLAIGGVLAVLVYMGGYVSGAHYNPAVTFAVWLQKKISSQEAARYVAVQLVGALVAASAFALLHGDKAFVAPAASTSFLAALLAELLFTFLLVSVVLHTAVSEKTKGNQYFGLAIGVSVLAGAFAVGAISGGAFNPAVGLGVNIFNFSELTAHFSTFWLYLLGPLLGGALASLAFTTTQQK